MKRMKMWMRAGIVAGLGIVLASAVAIAAGIQISTDTRWTRVNDGAAAAQTAINSTSVDMSGYHAAVFIVELGTVDATGTGTAVIAGSADDVTFVDLTGSSVAWTATDDEGIIILEVTNPLSRYLRCELARATADSVVDSIIAIQHQGRYVPVTQSGDVIGTDLVNGV